MTSLQGVVAGGVGEGAYFMSLDWVRRAVRDTVGFDPYPGTLNVRLVDGATVARWRELAGRAALALRPPSPETCGGQLVPVVVGDVPAAVVVPDVTRYGDDVLEVLAAVRLRDHLGLRDGDLVTLTHPA